jgi:hypothetical protein
LIVCRKKRQMNVQTINKVDISSMKEQKLVVCAFF